MKLPFCKCRCSSLQQDSHRPDSSSQIHSSHVQALKSQLLPALLSGTSKPADQPLQVSRLTWTLGCPANARMLSKVLWRWGGVAGTLPPRLSGEAEPWWDINSAGVLPWAVSLLGEPHLPPESCCDLALRGHQNLLMQDWRTVLRWQDLSRAAQSRGAVHAPAEMDSTAMSR